MLTFETQVFQFGLHKGQFKNISIHCFNQIAYCIIIVKVIIMITTPYSSISPLEFKNKTFLLSYLILWQLLLIYFLLYIVDQ